MKESSQTKHVKKKRELGLCGYSGCHNESKSYYCLEHQAVMTEATRRYYFRKHGKPMPEVKRSYKKLEALA